MATASNTADPLLEVLVFLTHYLHRPYTRAALLAGLPLQQGRLTLEIFQRAAHHAGIRATPLQLPFDQMAELTPPLLLLLKGGQVRLLLSQSGDSVQLYDPERGVVAPLSRSELEPIYSGRLFLLQGDVTFMAAPEDRESEPESERGSHWFWSTVWRGRALYRDVVIASLLINIFALAVPLFIMNVYDRVVPNSAMDTLWVLALGALGVVGFDFVLRLLRGYLLDVAGRDADRVLASRLFAQVMGLKLSVAPKSAGAFANHLREFESIREFLTSATLAAVIDLPFVLIFIGVIYLVGGPLALIPLLILPLLITLALLVQIPLRRGVGHLFEVGARKQALVVEAVSQLETIKILRAEGVLQGRWEQQVDSMAVGSLRVRLLSSVVLNSFNLLQQWATIGVVIAGVYLIQQGGLTMGSLFAAVILTGRAVQPLGQVVGLLNRYHYAASAIRALNRIMALPTDRPPQHRFIHRTAVAGRLELKGVDFTYPGQKSPTLQGVTLTLNPGERVGVLGRIGSGKSTLCKVMSGLYSCSSGQILLDGVDLEQWDPAELRLYLSLVAQESYLFAGTVRENLLLGAPYVSDEAMVQAAQRAGAHEFIQRLSGGYDYRIGENGAGLSAGQRQALAVARALLLQPPLLLLDEPTAQLDGASEQWLGQSLQALVAGRTLLLVTHRAPMLALVERLIVLEEGRIVADGPRDAILKQLATTGGRIDGRPV